MPLSQYKFSSPVMYQFGFSRCQEGRDAAAQIQRYGTTTTGIGRIIAQMGRIGSGVNRICCRP